MYKQMAGFAAEKKSKKNRLPHHKFYAGIPGWHKATQRSPLISYRILKMAKGRIQKKVKGAFRRTRNLSRVIGYRGSHKAHPSPMTAPSAHSRAARRASSPGIDTDKSLKEARPPAPSVNERPAVLAVLNAGGVTKKARKHGRKAVLSSRARRRQEKSAERAEAVVERTAKKMERSKGQAKTLHMRRKAWDEVNDNLTAGTLGKRKRQTTSGQDRAEALGGDGTDEEMDGAEGDQSQPSAGVHAPLMAVDEVVMDDTTGPASIPLPLPLEIEEEII